MGAPLTPGPSPTGRGGLPFYIDEQDGQDWGGDGIANPRIEYGLAMTDWVRMSGSAMYLPRDDRGR